MKPFIVLVRVNLPLQAKSYSALFHKPQGCNKKFMILHYL